MTIRWTCVPNLINIFSIFCFCSFYALCNILTLSSNGKSNDELKKNEENNKVAPLWHAVFKQMNVSEKCPGKKNAQRTSTQRKSGTN